MNWFKSNYDTSIEKYSEGWYGTMDYAPLATILLYNDALGYCVGYMEAFDNPDVNYITEAEAQALIASVDVDNPAIWAGDRLLHRWDEVKEFDEMVEGVW